MILEYKKKKKKTTLLSKYSEKLGRATSYVSEGYAVSWRALTIVLIIDTNFHTRYPHDRQTKVFNFTKTQADLLSVLRLCV